MNDEAREANENAWIDERGQQRADWLRRRADVADPEKAALRQRLRAEAAFDVEIGEVVGGHLRRGVEDGGGWRTFSFCVRREGDDWTFDGFAVSRPVYGRDAE